MELSELRTRFIPAIEEILDQCRITDDLVDKERFQVYMATIWGNAVLDPERSGIGESDLSALHDFFNEEIERVVGQGANVLGCFDFIVSKKGDESLARQGTTKQHKEFLTYFARLILNKEVEKNN
ncbi:MAG: hypothetical protein O6945_02910 [Gammaproteobacteria bacterium]|nr:hypothetical protein [Gammaproteobacteria bacterium]